MNDAQPVEVVSPLVQPVHIGVAEEIRVPERTSDDVVRTSSSVDTSQNKEVVEVDLLVRVRQRPEQVQVVNIEAANKELGDLEQSSP